eukprot:2147238-Rhodomonas_salina.1
MGRWSGAGWRTEKRKRKGRREGGKVTQKEGRREEGKKGEGCERYKGRKGGGSKLVCEDCNNGLYAAASMFLPS